MRKIYGSAINARSYFNSPKSISVRIQMNFCRGLKNLENIFFFKYDSSAGFSGKLKRIGRRRFTGVRAINQNKFVEHTDEIIIIYYSLYQFVYMPYNIFVICYFLHIWYQTFIPISRYGGLWSLTLTKRDYYGWLKKNKYETFFFVY